MLSDAFIALKSNLEPTDTFGEIISQRHNAVRSVIESQGRSVGTQLIGSLQRQTRIHPRTDDVFDIDVLVILGEFIGWLPAGHPGGVTPQMAMDGAHVLVQESDRYGAMSPRQDKPTITFSYADGVKVELVPAYRNNVGYSPTNVSHLPVGRGYWIPNSSGGWDFADYDHDAEQITRINRETGGTFVPLLKMLKAVKREHFPDMKSYHLEVMAANTMPGLLDDFRRSGVSSPSYPDLVANMLHRISGLLSTPLRLPGSNSPDVTVDEAARLQVAGALARVVERGKQALLIGSDTERQRIWREIFGEVMPAP